MQNAADGNALVQCGAQNHVYGPIASDLLALIEHMQTVMRLIEAAIDREAPPGDHAIAANVIILNDVRLASQRRRRP
jgi:hypothetical protein